MSEYYNFEQQSRNPSWGRADNPDKALGYQPSQLEHDLKLGAVLRIARSLEQLVDLKVSDTKKLKKELRAARRYNRRLKAKN